MGLGKTVQTASVLRHRAALGPALIVAPASVSFNWKVELARFVPSLRVFWFNEEHKLELENMAAGDVVVVSYDLLRASHKQFLRHWSTLVVDEVQFLKNHKAKRRLAVSALNRDFTIALSGTPVENHLGELWSVMSLCFPGLLGTESNFRARFQNPIEAPKMGEEGAAGARTAAMVLGRLLRPFLLRRTREEVLHELPPREEITLYVELSKDERQRYEALRGAFEKEFGRKKRERRVAKERIQVLAAITRLRQLACDASAIDPTFTARSAKLETLKEIAEELFRRKATVLVFSQFTTLLRKAEQAIQELGARTMYLDGATPLKSRRELVGSFQEGCADFLFISLTAGGTGLNLTHASHVIHLDPWWNPAIEEQATSRAHRMGQNKAVTVYRLVARATLEERILLMHRKKRDLVSAVLSGKADPKPLTQEELLSLFQEVAPLIG
jgi:SNF2 family DNA or RNA helicase